METRSAALWSFASKPFIPEARIFFSLVYCSKTASESRDINYYYWFKYIVIISLLSDAVIEAIVATCGLRSCGSRDPLLQCKLNPPRPGIKAMSPALAGGIPIHGTTREALKEHFTREKNSSRAGPFPGPVSVV